MAKKRLRDLEINRVALVQRGSNPRADIVFFKAHPESQEPSMKIPKLDRTKLSKEQGPQLDAILKAMGIEESELDPTKATPEEILKALPEPIAKAIQDGIDAAVKEAVAKAKKAKGAKADEDDEDDEDDDAAGREALLKSLSPKAKKAFLKNEQVAKDATAAAAAAQKSADEAKALAKVEQTKREESEFTKKNVAFIKAFPGDVDANGSLLYRVQKSVSPEDYAELEKMLKAGSEGITKTTEEIGSGQGGNTSAARDQLVKIANELMTKDDKLSYSKAFTKACRDNPKLHAEMNNDRRNKKSRDDDEE